MAEEETPSLTWEFTGESHSVLECTTPPLPQESAPEGPNMLVGIKESNWKPTKS